MKRIIFILTATLASFIALTACNEFELNEHLESIGMIAMDGVYNKQDSTTRRAYMIINIEGLNEDVYTIEYTIDGMPGVGANALHKPDQEKAQWTYNSQNFTGSILSGWDNVSCPRLEEELFSGEYDGNFPSGSTTTFHYMFPGVNRHPSMGSTHFLSPKLKPGKHTINFTVTNSYGESKTDTKEFRIQDEP